MRGTMSLLLKLKKNSTIQETDFGVYNIGSGIGTSIIELANQVNLISENSAPVIYAPRRNWDHILHRVSDISLAKSQLEFSPSVNLNEGLIKTFKWIKSINE